jgi:hypothetical protein
MDIMHDQPARKGSDAWETQGSAEYDPVTKTEDLLMNYDMSLYMLHTPTLFMNVAVDDARHKFVRYLNDYRTHDLPEMKNPYLPFGRCQKW